MQHSAFKDLGESVDIFAQTNKEDSLRMFMIDEDDVLTELDVSSSTIETIDTNLKKTNVTLPSEHSTVIAFLNEEPIFMRVGAPKIRFTFYTGQTGQTISYQQLNEDDASIIEEGDLVEFGEGIYGFNPSSTGNSIIKCQGLVYPLRVPYVVDSSGMAGTIYLQKNAWQMLAVPKDDSKIYEDFIAPIEDQTGMAAEDIFEVFNAYPYIDSQNREFLSFVPGVTNPLSKSNFQLIYEDEEGSKEITGFWCKTKDYEGDIITYQWDATT